MNLNITALSGTGNQIGSQLTNIANVLANTGNPLGSIATYLNQMLGAMKL